MEVGITILVWLASIGLTIWLAVIKGRNGVAWFGLSVLLGPMALLAMIGAPEVRK